MSPVGWALTYEKPSTFTPLTLTVASGGPARRARFSRPRSKEAPAGGAPGGPSAALPRSPPLLLGPFPRGVSPPQWEEQGPGVLRPSLDSPLSPLLGRTRCGEGHTPAELSGALTAPARPRPGPRFPQGAHGAVVPLSSRLQGLRHAPRGTGHRTAEKTHSGVC